MDATSKFPPQPHISRWSFFYGKKTWDTVDGTLGGYRYAAEATDEQMNKRIKKHTNISLNIAVLDNLGDLGLLAFLIQSVTCRF